LGHRGVILRLVLDQINPITSAETSRRLTFLRNCILLSESIGCFIDYKNTYGMKKKPLKKIEIINANIKGLLRHTENNKQNLRDDSVCF
jgi:hypothetical protein